MINTGTAERLLDELPEELRVEIFKRFEENYQELARFREVNKRTKEIVDAGCRAIIQTWFSYCIDLKHNQPTSELEIAVLAARQKKYQENPLQLLCDEFKHFTTLYPYIPKTRIRAALDGDEALLKTVSRDFEKAKLYGIGLASGRNLSKPHFIKDYYNGYENIYAYQAAAGSGNLAYLKNNDNLDELIDVALDMAVQRDQLHVVDHLYYLYDMENTALESALNVAVGEGHLRIISFILAQDEVDEDIVFRVLIKAIKYGQFEIVKYLFHKTEGTNSLWMDDLNGLELSEAFVAAARNGYFETVNYLLWKKKYHYIYPNAFTFQLAVREAICEGHTSVLKVLLPMGRSLYSYHEFIATAISVGTPQILVFLLAELKLAKSDFNYSLLTQAAEKNKPAHVKFLLANYPWTNEEVEEAIAQSYREYRYDEISDEDVSEEDSEVIALLKAYQVRMATWNMFDELPEELIDKISNFLNLQENATLRTLNRFLRKNIDRHFQNLVKAYYHYCLPNQDNPISGLEAQVSNDREKTFNENPLRLFWQEFQHYVDLYPAINKVHLIAALLGNENILRQITNIEEKAISYGIALANGHVFASFNRPKVAINAFKVAAGTGNLAYLKRNPLQNNPQIIKEALCYATLRAQYHVVHYLKQNYVLSNETLGDALALAGCCGNLRMLRYIFDLSEDAILPLNQALTMAAMNGQLEMVQYCLKNDEIDFRYKVFALKEAIENGHYLVVQCLYAQFDNPDRLVINNQARNYLYQAFVKAVLLRHEKTIEFILSVHSFDRTVLRFVLEAATIKNYKNMVALLLPKYPCDDIDKECLVLAALPHLDIALLQFLINELNIDIQNLSFSILKKASKLNHVICVEYLLANYEWSLNEVESALTVAERKQHKEVVLRLKAYLEAHSFYLERASNAFSHGLYFAYNTVKRFYVPNDTSSSNDSMDLESESDSEIDALDFTRLKLA